MTEMQKKPPLEIREAAKGLARALLKVAGPNRKTENTDIRKADVIAWHTTNANTSPPPPPPPPRRRYPRENKRLGRKSFSRNTRHKNPEPLLTGFSYPKIVGKLSEIEEKTTAGSKGNQCPFLLPCFPPCVSRKGNRGYRINGK